MPAKGAADFVPDTHDPAELSTAAQSCKGCDLYLNATQTVFGEGSADADIMIVGEQPGDQEDRVGAPFVGPAGKLLDKALAAADVDRDRLYVTNAVKHFKFTLPERGKRRIHKTPSRTEVVACRPWLFAEMMSVQPDVVVLLGATAAKSLMGNDFRLPRTAARRCIYRSPRSRISTSTRTWWCPRTRRRCCAGRRRTARRRSTRWCRICGSPPGG